MDTQALFLHMQNVIREIITDRLGEGQVGSVLLMLDDIGLDEPSNLDRPSIAAIMRDIRGRDVNQFVETYDYCVNIL